jgi:hypothetical protein
LAVDRDDSEHVTHDLFVELETIAGHEGDTNDFAAMDRLVEKELRVPVGAAAQDLVGHSRDDTSTIVNSQVVLVFFPTKVQSSSA